MWNQDVQNWKELSSDIKLSYKEKISYGQAKKAKGHISWPRHLEEDIIVTS